MAILLFSSPPHVDRGPVLLLGANSQVRFQKWLHNTCLLCQEDILALGLEIAAIGSHSLRKGAASELSSCPGAPPTVAVWLRAGWSLGNVAQRYIFQQPGGDQFVGRCASGINTSI